MEEAVYALAISRLKGISLANARLLYDKYGSATAVFKEGAAEPGRIREALREHAAEALQRAEAEMDFCRRKGIRVLCMGDADYPARLRECGDAPLVLFYRGTADLNARHVVAVVGTRHVTEYGKDICRNFCAELKGLVPDALVISGLAYGVDIHAHRAALENGLQTVAVLAHGLDRIYPPLHRDTAKAMLQQGGLLTEYMSQTNPDKGNFVRRNRIIAGLADATVVVESAAKGGALITARLAQDYNREVFAFPGRVADQYSEGCNMLIRTNGAALATSAACVAEALGWTAGTRKEPVQRELFPQMSEEEEAVCRTLQGNDGKQINSIVVESNLPIHKVSALLFELELKGVVKPLAGGRYRLL